MEFLKQIGIYFGLAIQLIGAALIIPGGIVYDLGTYLMNLLGEQEQEEE